MSGETDPAFGLGLFKHIVVMGHPGGNVWAQQAKLNSSSKRHGQYFSLSSLSPSSPSLPHRSHVTCLLVYPAPVTVLDSECVLN